jgi:hypothetical protein
LACAAPSTSNNCTRICSDSRTGSTPRPRATPRQCSQ